MGWGCHKWISKYVCVVYLVILLTSHQLFYMVVHVLFLFPSNHIWNIQYFHILNIFENLISSVVCRIEIYGKTWRICIQSWAQFSESQWVVTLGNVERCVCAYGMLSKNFFANMVWTSSRLVLILFWERISFVTCVNIHIASHKRGKVIQYLLFV